MENKLIVSLSPHVHGGDSVQKNMYGVLIALIPAFLVSLYFFGLGARPLLDYCRLGKGKVGAMIRARQAKK